MTERAQPGPYAIEYGDVWYYPPQGAVTAFVEPKRHVCRGSEMLAVCYDREEGILHKHGAEPAVRKWFEAAAKKFVEAGFDELAEELELVVFPPMAECVDELNACIATTGRILQLPERLAAIAAATPREYWPVTYPR